MKRKPLTNDTRKKIIIAGLGFVTFFAALFARDGKFLALAKIILKKGAPVPDSAYFAAVTLEMWSLP